MDNIQQQIGTRLKYFRKLRGMTLGELAELVNKSKSAISKYEKGKITLDIVTIIEIAEALCINPSVLLDYHPKTVISNAIYSNSEFYRDGILYVYYYDGRRTSVTCSVISFECEDPSLPEINAHFFAGVSDYAFPSKCHHYYKGTMQYFDMITHMNFTNEINPVEKIQLTIINPLSHSSAATGMLMGFSERPFGNIALKAIISPSIIQNTNTIMNDILFSKEELNTVKKYNMLLVSSLGADT